MELKKWQKLGEIKQRKIIENNKKVLNRFKENNYKIAK